MIAATSSDGATGGTPLWTNRYDGPVNDYDYPNALAVDSSGNVVVAGALTDTDSRDLLVLKYSGQGVPLWTNSYHAAGSALNQANAVAVDAADNVFVTGYTTPFSGYGRSVTVAYSSAGIPLWTNLYSEPGGFGTTLRAIAADKNGNVFVTGVTEPATGGLDYVTLAYSNAGVPLWTNRYGTASSDIPSALALDNNGNVFVTGESQANCVTVAYSNAGAPLWTNIYNGPYESGNATDQGVALAVDSQGNILVTGSSLDNNLRYDWITLKYSNSGIPLWTNRHNGQYNLNDYGANVAVDGSDNVFVTGESDNNFVTIKYTGAGVPVWTNQYRGPGFEVEYPGEIAVDAGGNVFVAGRSNGDVTGDDYAIVAYSNAGLPLWTNRYNGPVNGSDAPCSIGVDAQGNIFVTGSSPGTNFVNDVLTIKYSTALTLPIPLNAQRFDHELVLTWESAAFTLQTAPAIGEAFTNIPGATSPFTNIMSGPQQFFRLISN